MESCGGGGGCSTTPSIALVVAGGCWSKGGKRTCVAAGMLLQLFGASYSSPPVPLLLPKPSLSLTLSCPHPLLLSPTRVNEMPKVSSRVDYSNSSVLFFLRRFPPCSAPEVHVTAAAAQVLEGHLCTRSPQFHGSSSHNSLLKLARWAGCPVRHPSI